LGEGLSFPLATLGEKMNKDQIKNYMKFTNEIETTPGARLRFCQDNLKALIQFAMECIEKEKPKTKNEKKLSA